MASNRGVVYVGPGKVEVRSIDFPKLVDPRGKRCDHGVILKVVSTNICGSDQHMVRGRTTAQPGLVLGHEITGEVIEAGRDVQFIRPGDLVSLPFNVACGRCRTCREGETGVCLNVNPERAGGAYGYVDMGGWIGGQAEYVMVPYADFNCLKFPDKAHAMEKIRDLTCLSDILPTGFHGAVTAKVGVGSTVYVAGAGPLAPAKNVGFEPIDLTRHDRLGEMVADVLGVPEVDCAIDCVGFEAKAQGTDGKIVEAPAVVLNRLMEITRAAGAIGIPGLYVTDDPAAKELAAKNGNLSLRLGLGWAKSHSLHTGQTPVLKYNRQRMQAILWDRLPIAKIVNVKVIDLEQAPEGYKSFDAGVANKYVIDPHGQLSKAA